MDRARRAQPSANPIITRQWTMHCMKMHNKKIRSVKASIDNKPPKPMRHLRRNLKREQMREERYSAIERENRILLQKMAAILRTNKTMDTINSYKARSLNRASRRRELIRITQENQGILRRIQASEPTYNHLAWEEERRAMEKRMDNISAYDRHGREKVLHHIKSRARLARQRGGGGRSRPQSAPIYQVGRRSSRDRGARPSSAMPRRTYVGAGSGAGDGIDVDDYQQVLQRRGSGSSGAGAGAGAGARRPGSASRSRAYRPGSARRTRGGRPTSAARRRPGNSARVSASAMNDPDLVAGAELGGDVEAVFVGEGDEGNW